MAIKKTFIVLLFTLVLFTKPLMSQGYNLFQNAILYVDSLLDIGELKYVVNNHSHVFSKDNKILQIYDLYSCSCMGQNEVLDETPITSIIEYSGLEKYKSVRLDNSNPPIEPTLSLIICNKKQSDETESYIQFRVIEDDSYSGYYSVKLKLYFINSTIVKHVIINEL